MTPEEFRAELAALGVTQTWLADRLNVKRQVVSRWANNGSGSPVPSWMPFLLELLRERTPIPLAEMPEIQEAARLRQMTLPEWMLAQLRQAAARDISNTRYIAELRGEALPGADQHVVVRYPPER